MSTKWETIERTPVGTMFAIIERYPVPGGWIYRTNVCGAESTVFVPAVTGPNAVAVNQRVRVSIARVADRPTYESPHYKELDAATREAYGFLQQAATFAMWPTHELPGGLFAIDPTHVDVPHPECSRLQREFYEANLVGATVFGIFQDGKVAIVTDKGLCCVVSPAVLTPEGAP